MRSKLTSIGLFLFLCSTINAQKQTTSPGIGIGPRFAFGVVNPGRVTDYGIGGEVQAEVAFDEKLTLLLSAGYTYFSELTVFGTSSNSESIGVIPILAGLRFYPIPRFFVGSKIGYGRKLNIDPESMFLYEPQIGYNSRRIQLSFGRIVIIPKSRKITSWLLGFLVKLN